MAALLTPRTHQKSTVFIIIVLNLLRTSGSQQLPDSSARKVSDLENQNSENILPIKTDSDAALNDQDNEVDIEDVELEGSDPIGKRSVYTTSNDDNAKKNSNKETNGNGNNEEPTAVAKVYEDPVPNFTASTTDSENSDKSGKSAISKPARIKVACWDYRNLENLEEIVPPQVENEASTVENETGTTESVIKNEEIPEESFLEKPISDAEENVTRDIDGLDTANRTLEIVNMTYLLHDVLYINPAVKLRSTPSNCSVVMFYATWCPFSAKAAPHFNALPRAYPPLRVAAIDSSKYKQVNTYFGILSVPTVVLFHNGKIIAKFNDTAFTLNKFSEFIEYFSDLKHEERMSVTTKDFEGPLPAAPTKEVDWYLYISWVFIIACFFHYVSKSAIWRRAVDFVRTTWREAEAQHEHID